MMAHGREHATVVLLRSPNVSGPDPYVAAFEAAGFRAQCLPVLQFTFLYQEALGGRLTHPGRYGGLVLTSPRAARALSDALPRETDQSAAWKEKPAFVVGPRTGEALKALGFAPEGAETGSADALAAFIARIYSSAPPLLFLCGNRRRDTLPDGLRAAGVPFEEQIVYETHPRTDVDFRSRPAPDWLAFFSPSGIEAIETAEGLDREAVRIAAIGPTTAAALGDAGWHVDAVADEPTPEALLEAVQATTDG